MLPFQHRYDLIGGSSTNMLQRLTRITIAAFSFLFPVLFLPFTADTHEYVKLVLLILTDALLLSLFALRIIQEKKLILTISTFTIPFLVLTAITALSTTIQASNPFVALSTPLSFSTIIGMTVLYLLLSQENSNEYETLLMFPLTVGAGLVSLYSIMMRFGMIPFSIFTPAGNLLATTMSLSIIAVYLLGSLIRKTRYSPLQRRVSIAIFLFITTAAGLLTWQLFTSHRPIILPFTVGTGIASSIFEHPRTLFFGVGMGNFLSAYTLEKPLSFNQSQYWNISFTTSSSYFLTLLTEAGILAIVVYMIIFFITIYRSLASPQPASFALIVALLLQLVLPSNMAISILIVILLILTSKNSYAEVPITRKAFLYLIPATSIFLLAGTLFYAGIRSYFAELYYYQSLSAMNAGKGNEAYNLQKRTLEINPTLDRYHVTFSQTNLVLANTFASEASPSPESKSLIPSLVQQSLDEGKSAIARNPTNAANWTYLGSLYASLIGFAEESDRWAIESYEKAQKLDPYNPSIPVGMASVYQKTEHYDQADIQLRKALTLKPDFTAASIFLAKQQEQLGQINDAKNTLETARSQIIPGSQEYALLEDELKRIQ